MIPNNENELPECFVIMPISDPPGYDPGHFSNVYNDIFKEACSHAGYKPIRADEESESNVIHLAIIKRLIECPMAICDLSSNNPNVFFELGIRQAFDRPTVIVAEFGNTHLFDTGIIRVTPYDRKLRYKQSKEAIMSIAESIKSTKRQHDSGSGVNSLVKLLGVAKATIPNATSLSERDINGYLINSIDAINIQIGNLASRMELISTPERTQSTLSNNNHLVSLDNLCKRVLDSIKSRSSLSVLEAQYSELFHFRKLAKTLNIWTSEDDLTFDNVYFKYEEYRTKVFNETARKRIQSPDK